MRCVNCSAELLPEAQFCGACGNPVAPTTCPRCSAPLPPNALFCGQCGASLPAAPQQPTAFPTPAVPAATTSSTGAAPAARVVSTDRRPRRTGRTFGRLLRVLAPVALLVGAATALFLWRDRLPWDRLPVIGRLAAAPTATPPTQAALNATSAPPTAAPPMATATPTLTPTTVPTALPTATVTAPPTETPTPELPTATPLPTATRRPTRTPAPTATVKGGSAPEGGRVEIERTGTPTTVTSATAVVTAARAALRSGPGTDYPALPVSAVAGDRLTVIGRNPAGDWLALGLIADAANNGRAWIAAADVQLQDAAADQLPLIEAPVLPTATPRPTSAPTAQPTNPPTPRPTATPTPRPTATPTPRPTATRPPTAVATPTPTATVRPAPTATATATTAPTPTPTVAPTPTPSPTVGPLEPLAFTFSFGDCRYVGSIDWICTLTLNPRGGSGPPYTFQIFDADPPNTLSSVSGSATHDALGRRCNPWVHEVRLIDERGGQTVSQNIYFDPKSHNGFPSGGCTLP